MKKNLDSSRYNTRDLSLIVFLTLLIALVVALINPNFIGKYNLISIGQNLAPYAMLALGVLMPISMGGTDLSIGAVCIGSAVIAGKLYALGMPLGLTIPVMMLFGTLIGCVNGVLISKFRIQPFIATLGTMMFTRGFTAILADAPTVLYPSGSWFNKLFSSWNGFPVSFLWVILFALLLYFIYRRTKLGRYMVSIGSNEKATAISGVDVDRVKIIGYAGAGLMAGVAAVFWVASFATVTVATGNGMELDAIASVYIGGTSATGGLANVFGAVVGSIMLVVIRSGLNYALASLNITVNSTYVTYVISGIVVVGAVLAEKRKAEKSGLREKKGRMSPVRKRRIFNIGSIVMAGILAVISIAGIGFTGKNEKLICLAFKSESSAYWQQVGAGAERAGKESGYEVLARGPEGEDPSFLPKQREIVSTLLAKQPAGLAIATIADGFTDLLEEAYDRKIPVVEYDSGLYSEDKVTITSSGKNPLKSYIRADNYRNASVAAENVFEAIRDDIAKSSDYTVGVIQFENSEPAAQRSGGFRDTILALAEADPETKGKVNVLVEVKPSASNNAYKDALEYLYEKGCKFIYLTGELVVNQVSDAVNAAGGKYDGIKFGGFDTGEKALEWLNSDSESPLLGLMSQEPEELGYLTVKTLVDIAEGKPVEEEVIVPGKWLTKESLKESSGK